MLGGYPGTTGGGCPHGEGPARPPSVTSMETRPQPQPGARVENRYRHAGLFFLLATAIPWALWLPAAWFSRQPDSGLLVGVLGIAGLLAPVGVVAWLTRGDRDLARDMLRRLDVRGVRPVWLLVACGLMPAAVVVATLISLPLGYSADQLLLRGAFTFTAGLIPGWVVIVLAPVAEELAWHSYGTDSLRRRFTVFTTSMVFGVIWAVWHLPLALIEGSSQNQTAEQGVLHALNFPLSVFPFVLLMNWIYYRSDRNITVTILFHLSANLVTQVLATHPDTEVIATGVLLVTTTVVVIAERRLFFEPAIAPRPTSDGDPAGQGVAIAA